MLCHWRYVLDNLFGEVRSGELPRRHAHSRALGRAGQALRRRRRRRRPTPPSSSRAASSRRSTAPGARACGATISSPSRSTARTARRWPGCTDCLIQARQATPQAGVEPGREAACIDFFGDWQEVPENATYDNGFKAQWELFIRHVCEDAPFRYTLLEGAKGVQLAECAASRAGASGAGSTSPRSRCEEVDAMNRPVLPVSSSSAESCRAADRSHRDLSPRGVARVSRATSRHAQPHRLRRGPCRLRSARRCRSLADGGGRLGQDDRLPRASLGPRPRRRRGDGHRPARHGARLADLARTDPRSVRRRRRGARWCFSGAGTDHLAPRMPRASTT